jgi:anti-anti-sigma regulatory factor
LPIILEHSERANLIHLQGAIDISLAAELKTTLLEALSSRKPLRVALSADADLDVTAIQLLWAAEREAKATDAGFMLDGCVPDSVSTTLKLSGFEKFPVPV